jgi:hypothetical protein
MRLLVVVALMVAIAHGLLRAGTKDGDEDIAMPLINQVSSFSRTNQARFRQSNLSLAITAFGNSFQGE